MLLPDGPGVHAAFVGIERAGAVIVGIGPRAGDREVEHLLGTTGASLVLSTPGTAALAARSGIPHLVAEEVAAGRRSRRFEDRPYSDRDLWLLNSTSGTTGLPKCVMHDQARWFAFHDLAVDAAALSRDDVFMSVLPAPFGFGIWTGHVTPTVLGAPCVVMPGFDADECLALDRAQPCERARRGVDAARDAPARRDPRRPRSLEPAGAVHRWRDGSVPPGRGVRGPHRVLGAPVLRVERDGCAFAHDACRRPRASAADGRSGHPRDARAALRRRRLRRDRGRRSRHRRVQGRGELPRVLRGPRGERTASSPPMDGC